MAFTNFVKVLSLEAALTTGVGVGVACFCSDLDTLDFDDDVLGFDDTLDVDDDDDEDDDEEEEEEEEEEEGTVMGVGFFTGFFLITGFGSVVEVVVLVD